MFPQAGYQARVFGLEERLLGCKVVAEPGPWGGVVRSSRTPLPRGAGPTVAGAKKGASRETRPKKRCLKPTPL